MSTLAILRQARKQQVATRLQLREMTVDDIPAVVEIVKQNYDVESAKLATWERMSATTGMKPQPVYFVALIADVIVGVLGIGDSFMDTRVYEIFWVNVLPEWQRTGVGKRLVKRALELAVERKCQLILFTAKESVVEFYQGLGFFILAPVETDESKDYLLKARPEWALKHVSK